MALTKNQLRWADIYIKNEGDRKKIIEGEDPLEILRELNLQISLLCKNLDSAADSSCLEKISNISERVEDIIKYLKETTVPI